jgi:hypothetical protein
MPSSSPRVLSTRFAIVEQSLADATERLRDLVGSPQVRELRSRAQSYERAVQSWKTLPPTEEQRATLLKLVLELHVEVISLGKVS